MLGKIPVAGFFVLAILPIVLTEFPPSTDLEKVQVQRAPA